MGFITGVGTIDFEQIAEETNQYSQSTEVQSAKAGMWEYYKFRLDMRLIHSDWKVNGKLDMQKFYNAFWNGRVENHGMCARVAGVAAWWLKNGMRSRGTEPVSVGGDAYTEAYRSFLKGLGYIIVSTDDDGKPGPVILNKETVKQTVGGHSTFLPGDIVTYWNYATGENGHFHAQMYTGPIYKTSRYKYVRKDGTTNDLSCTNSTSYFWQTDNKTNYKVDFVY